MKAVRLVNAETCFDAKKYFDVLILAGANVLSPLGCIREELEDEMVYGEKQMVLNAF